jgi:predicted DNA-binding transcriptional regulator AlpA
MAEFDPTVGQMLSLEQVAVKLKLRLAQLDRLIATKQFPTCDKSVNGVQYWNDRSVQTWLGHQPTK